MTEPISVPVLPWRAATAKDVAERAGVARPTVSAVLNGAKSGTSVSSATRERILEAARELGYRPNLAARSTRSGKSRQIGLLIRNFSRSDATRLMAHPLSYEIVCGVSDGLEDAGYLMCLMRLGDLQQALESQNALQGHLFDGVVVVSDVHRGVIEGLEKLVRHQIWVDGNVWNAHGCVRRDEEFAARLCAQKVAEMGYKRWFALFHATSPHYSSPQRMAGLEAVARECGAQIVPVALRHAGSAEMAPLLDELQPDDAVIATTFYSAQTLQNALVLHDKRPPRDFALVCCDDGFHREGSAWQELSRVSFDRYQMGFTAAQMMVEQLENGTTPPSQLLRGEWQSGRTAKHRI